MDKLEKTLGYSFKTKSLLDNALTHRSFLNENKGKNLQSNERVEFLGDAVLELATSKFLFHKLPSQPEGELTNLRASLVKTETLAKVAQQLNLGAYLKMSRGEKQSGGQTNPSLLANTVEAIIGAIYLDSGFPAAEKFIQTHIFPKLDQIIKLGLDRDWKSTLQELIQSTGKPTPTYITTKESGPDHHKRFVVQAKVNSKILSSGTGNSKQRAQQQAAKNALKRLKDS